MDTMDHCSASTKVFFKILTFILGLVAAYTNGEHIVGMVRNKVTYCFFVLNTLLLPLAAMNFIIAAYVIILVFICFVEDFEKETSTGNDDVISVLKTLGPVVFCLWSFVTGTTLVARGVLLLHKSLNFRDTTRARVEISCLGALYVITMGIVFIVVSGLQALVVAITVTTAVRYKSIFKRCGFPDSQLGNPPWLKESNVIPPFSKQRNVTLPSQRESTVTPSSSKRLNLTLTSPRESPVIRQFPTEPTEVTSTVPGSVTLPEPVARSTRLDVLAPEVITESALPSSLKTDEDNKEDDDEREDKYNNENEGSHPHDYIHQQQQRILARDATCLLWNFMDVYIVVLPLTFCMLIDTDRDCSPFGWVDFAHFVRRGVKGGICHPPSDYVPFIMAYLLPPIFTPLSWLRITEEFI